MSPLASCSTTPRNNSLIASGPGKQFYRVNRSTGVATDLPSSDSVRTGLAYVPTVGEMYVVTAGPSGFEDDELSRVHPDGSVQPLFDLTGERLRIWMSWRGTRSLQNFLVSILRLAEFT